MSWITLTESHLASRVSAGEIDKFRATGPADASSDRIADLLDQVTNFVRGKVASCGENIGRMGPAGTIPDELLMPALTVARGSIVTSVPVMEGETDPRGEELRQAYRELDRAAKCEIRIAAFGDTAAESAEVLYGGKPLLEF